MSILDDVLNEDPKQIDEKKPSIIEASNENVEDFIALLCNAKSTIHSGDPVICGKINGVTLSVPKGSTPTKLLKKYYELKKLQYEKVSDSMIAFRSPKSGELKTLQSKSEGSKNYEEKLIDTKKRLDEEQPGNDGMVYGVTGADNKSLTVDSGMTLDELTYEAAQLNTTKTSIKSDVYEKAMSPEADVKEKIIDLAKKFKDLNLKDPSAVLSWLNEAQGFTSKMDPKLVKEIIDKIEGAGYKENKNTGNINKNTGNIISLDNMSAEDVARWAVGRALAGLKQDGNIRPGISRVVGDLKKYAA